MDAGKPLGYWLQHLHNLLERHFDLALSDVGIDRRTWQLLNTLARGPRDRAGLEAALAPFWDGDGPRLPSMLAALSARGWISETDGMIRLSPTGLAAHGEISPRVERSRAVVMAGLTRQQYEETVRLLAVMSGNVEAALASR